jgi:uncharacterized protein YkwD
MDYEWETPPRRNMALPILLGLAGAGIVGLIFIIGIALKSPNDKTREKSANLPEVSAREEHMAWEQDPLPPPEEPMFLPAPMEQREFAVEDEDESPIFENIERTRTPPRKRPVAPRVPKEIEPAPADDNPAPASKTPAAEPDPTLSKTDNDVLARVNAFRKLTGLGPVTVSAKLSEGCLAHAKYLIANQGEMATKGLDPHRERKDVPGYSENGYKAGLASVIASSGGYIHGGWPTGAVNVWMATFYHRVPILNPHLKKIGIGYVLDVDKKLCQVVMDVQSGVDWAGMRNDRERMAVVFPAHEQQAVPVLFGLGMPESPNPLPAEAGQSRISAGYPITVTFPRRVSIRNVTAKLSVKRDHPSQSTSNDIPAWVSSPEKPAIPNSPIMQGSTICIISKSALNRETSYSVTVAADIAGQPWSQSWSFTTKR